MIWLMMFGLIAGALLAQQFKVAALVPATVLVVFFELSFGLAHSSGSWSIILVVTIAIVGMQAGYFIGMLFQHGLGALSARRSAPFTNSASTRDSVP